MTLVTNIAWIANAVIYGSIILLLIGLVFISLRNKKRDKKLERELQREMDKREKQEGL